MLKIDTKCQQYDWGKIGNNSLVARLAKSAGGDNFILDEKKPYAELWMGTHPSGPATVQLNSGSNAMLLSEWLKEHKETIGIVPTGYRQDDLPFMFKVLSINTALSIQAHPDKTLAAELHASFPNIYKDPNHKPEMAIALTTFEGMNGFRPLAEINNHVDLFPEFAAIIGEDVVSQIRDITTKVSGSAGVWKDRFYSSSGMASVEKLSADQALLVEKALRLIMKSLLYASDAHVNPNLKAMISRMEELQGLPAGDARRILPSISQIILKLHKDYPGDRGVLFPLILNTIELRPGEAFYMAANEPHAYISGDIMECMALSDNVVRAGLTPKFQDKPTLERMLVYKSAPVSYCKVSTLDAFTRLYRPPVASFSEFEVEHIVVSSSQKYDVIVHPCASIIIFTSCKKGEMDDMSFLTFAGQSIPLPSAGTVFYQYANQPLRVQTGKGTQVEIFRAHINLGAISQM